MYFSLSIIILLILGMIITGFQNSKIVEITFIAWKFELSVAALIFFSSLIGAAIVAILILPKLLTKHLKTRRLQKEVNELRHRSIDLEGERDKSPVLS